MRFRMLGKEDPRGEGEERDLGHLLGALDALVVCGSYC